LVGGLGGRGRRGSGGRLRGGVVGRLAPDRGETDEDHEREEKPHGPQYPTAADASQGGPQLRTSSRAGWFPASALTGPPPRLDLARARATGLWSPHVGHLLRRREHRLSDPRCRRARERAAGPLAVARGAASPRAGTEGAPDRNGRRVVLRRR